MTILPVIAVCAVILILAYVTYGRLVVRWLGVDPSRTTPAVEMEDGNDFVPAPAPVVLGGHFTAIAAAGPVAQHIVDHADVSADDLDDETKARVQAAAVPVPEGVARGIVHLRDERRLAVPAVLVCPEFSPTQAREWIDGGDTPELARIHDLELVDIDSGHWPMFTQPRRLAELLVDAVPATD